MTVSMLEQGFEIEREFCEKYGIPYLQISPVERLRALLAYRNDRRLYRRKCDATGESLISSYRPDCGFQIVKSDVWWGDSWDGLDFAQNTDPTKPFFQQFAALNRRVPREGTSVIRAENSDYNSHTRDSKDCYLSHLAVKAETLLFSYWTVGARDVLEGFYTTDCELCARCSYVTKCYGCVHLVDCSSCNDCHFSSELRGCSNCLFCYNLSGKHYYLYNQPCSKEQFEAAKSQFLSGDEALYTAAVGILEKNLLTQPRRAQHTLNSENVCGDHIQNSRDVFNAFDVLNCDRGFNVTNGGGDFIVHSYSVGFPSCSHVFSSVTVRDSSQIFFSANCWNSHNLWYCDNCVNCTDCFGCVGLKRRRFCVFNREYTETDYRELLALWREQMIERGEWGLFFPTQYSPFCYDETAAQDFFPLSREDIVCRGWQCSPVSETAAHESSANSSLPAGAKKCQVCSKAYLRAPKEIDLCQQFGVPLSTRCPDCRITHKLETRSPYALVERLCSKCQGATLTSLSENLSQNPWCEKCFLEQIY